MSARGRLFLRAGLVLALAGSLAGCTSEHEVSMREFVQFNFDDDVFKVEGEPYSGLLVVREDDVVRARMELDDGHPDGSVELFHENGEPAKISEIYWDTKKHKLVNDGKITRWNEDGVMRSRSEFDNDELVLEESWCDNRKPSERVEYDDGKKEKGTSWSCETGRKTAELKYNGDGKLDGEQQYWAPDGTRIGLIHYLAGELNGLQEAWYPNGKPRSKGQFNAGKQVGKQEAWDTTGQLAESGTFSPAGEKTGMWLETTSNWIDGVWTGYAEPGTVPGRMHYGPEGFIKPELVGPYVEALGDGDRPDAEVVAFYLKEGQVSAKDALPAGYNGGASSSSFSFPQSNWTYAVIVASPTVLQVLLDNGADINQADSRGHTRLMRCASRFNAGNTNRTCDLGHLNTLISKGAKAGTVDDSGRNALHYLLDDSDSRDKTLWGRTVPAAVQARKDAIAALVAAGADVNTRDKEGWTPLVLALSERRGDLALALIEQGADVKVEGPGGTQPIHWVFLLSPDRYQINEGEFTNSMLQALTAKGADVNASMPWDGSSVKLRDLAMRHGLIKLVAQLDSMGAK